MAESRTVLDGLASPDLGFGIGKNSVTRGLGRFERPESAGEAVISVPDAGTRFARDPSGVRLTLGTHPEVS